MLSDLNYKLWDTDASAGKESEAQIRWDAQRVGEWVEVELESLPFSIQSLCSSTGLFCIYK